MDREGFWERTNSLLRERGFTQGSLSEKCGFTGRRIENLSGDQRFPKVYEVVRIAKELGTSAEYLVTGKNIKYPGLSEGAIKIALAADKLNDSGKKAALSMVEGLEKDFPLAQTSSADVG
jgi:transcriptional regulator with XRE-family HTH domain